MMDGGVLLEGWCTLLLDGLVEGGVREVILSPGSRSTPLVLAADRHQKLTTYTIVDERSAAFFALGRIRACGWPTVLIQTSGSAAGHDFPAVIEAAEARYPLLIVTADRPCELMAARAPQTIDQLHLFGRYVSAFFELGTPDPSELALKAVRRIGVQAATRAQSLVPGPVHVNLRARKPLEPPEGRTAEQDSLSREIDRMRSQKGPHIYMPRPLMPSREGLERIKEVLGEAKKPLIVAGPSPALKAHDRRIILEWLAPIGCPTYLEATSQLRFGPQGQGTAGMEAAFLAENLRPSLAPDVVIQLGEPPIGTGFQQALKSWTLDAHLVLTPYGYPDPTSSAEVVEAHISETCRQLGAEAYPPQWDTQYLNRWREVEAKASQLAQEALQMADVLTEGQVAFLARQVVPEGGRLMVGNSLPVRHLDRFVPGGGSSVDVLHQRGASGIDGLIAGALGASRDGPGVLLLGDVSARHDLGSLALSEHAGADLTVIVIHNGGGRIFEQLPLARKFGLDHPILKNFTTPSEVSLAPIAQSLGWRAIEVHTLEELEATVGTEFSDGQPRWIEAHVPSHDAIERLNYMVSFMNGWAS